MKKEEHYTNGFLTKIWNNLVCSQDSISQKLEDTSSHVKWISIVPNALDNRNIKWKFKIFIYKINNENNIDEYPLDMDLFTSIESEYYCSTVEALLFYLDEHKINNSNFDVSWKINAPF